ncbi:cupin domain-containing protein [Clostridium sp. P21]|uniref:Cupin domain-containing protein n=1 Tax=Clostridium muellerianum TaxID=2716538 RepID=A0A7Y0EP25_9CLOT|nr:cupin domain-containing protein [Clostridium muellerianum]NMM65875.1 cupin domain-containing protein [Clostridium muellerianum]
MQLAKISDYQIYSDDRFVKKDMINEEKALLFMLNLKPGQKIPPHTHGESGLTIHVISGSGIVNINSKAEKITVGNIIYCSGTELFGMENTSEENLSCFASLTK